MNRVKIKNCCNLIDYRGKTPEKSDSGYILITAKNVKDDGFSFEPREYIPKENYDAVMVRGIPESGDVLFTTEAPLGNVCRIPEMKEPFAVGQRIVVICPKDDILRKDFLEHVLKSQRFRDDMWRRSSGSTVKGIRTKELIEIEIPIPDLKQQKTIAESLNKISIIINVRQQQLEELDNLIKSRFVEMFGDPDTNPNGYEVKRIDEVAELIKRITYSPEQVANEGMIVLRSSNIKGSDFDLQDLVKITKGIDESKWVKENDILMCNRNGSARLVGKVAKIPKLDESMTFGTFMTVVRSEYYEYLFTFFHTKAFRRQIQFQTAVAINQISLPLLAGVSVPIPPIDLQNKFATFVEATDKLKVKVKDSLDETQVLFDSLMLKYFD